MSGRGVIERFFGTLKYEHLYRTEIADGDTPAVEINWIRHVYNTIRPAAGRRLSALRRQFRRGMEGRGIEVGLLGCGRRVLGLASEITDDGAAT
jgi:putative transposase